MNKTAHSTPLVASVSCACADSSSKATRGQMPFIQQLSATECGAACLAMVLAYYGKHVPLSDIREATGVNRDGVDSLTY